MRKSSREDRERDGDYDEYDEGILFEEFVERAEENLHDPELKVIISILKKKGFKIKAKRLGCRIVSNATAGTRTKKITVNLALVDQQTAEIVITLLHRTLSVPMLTSEPTHRDHEFLRAVNMRW